MRQHESKSSAPDDIAAAARLNRVEEIVADLDSRIINGTYKPMYLGSKDAGIQSRQVAALIDLLVERGVL